MSNKTLMNKIALATINPAHAARLEKYADMHAVIFRANAARNAAMARWDIDHDYKKAAALARGKKATPADVKEYDRLKAARADYSEICRADYTAACTPARAEISAVITAIFGAGKNDKSNAAAAFRNFYATYVNYRMELSENMNTPAGRKAKSAAVSMLSACFGITFTGELANVAGRRIVNAIGVRLATMKEESKNNSRLSAFSETQVKSIVIALVLELIDVPFDTTCGKRNGIPA